MRPSKGNIVLDGQWLKDDEEVFVVAFYLPPRDSQKIFRRYFCILWLFASLKKTCLILSGPPATQKFSVWRCLLHYETIHQIIHTARKGLFRPLPK